MRASRLLSILLSLQAHGRLTASAMADELEVSERTIYRDIDELSAAGIPVIADRGRTGGFKLTDGFRTQLTGLTESEAETLFLAGLPGPVAELGLAELMAVARTKLMAALPAGARAERLAGRFHLDAAGWFRATDAIALLPTIARAVWNAHYVRFRYGEAKDSDVRKVGPVGLVLKAGVWYLVAQKGSAFRTYRVGRISEVEALDEPYTRPPKFDLAAWWARSSREYEVKSYTNSATIRLSPRGRTLLDLLGPYVVEAVAKTASEPDRQGWIRCTIPLESAGHGIPELMRLGVEVEVISPPALRTQIAQVLRNTLLHYSKRSGRGAAPLTREAAESGTKAGGSPIQSRLP